MLPDMKTNTFAVATVSFMVWVATLPAAFGAAGEHKSEIEDGAHHEYHRNLFAVFVGVAADGRRNNGLALGIEYERRFSQSFGVGVLAEHTFGELDFRVYSVPFAYHTDRWKFYIAPGVEDGDHTEFLLRLGGEYGFEVGAWEIAPQVDVDFVDSHVIPVLGVTFGKGF
jgi:hypothetical protein